MLKLYVVQKEPQINKAGCAVKWWQPGLGNVPRCGPNSASKHRQTWKSPLMFWPVSLPFVHGELCVRVQQGPAFQIWAFRESEREDLLYLHHRLSCVWFSLVLIYICNLCFLRSFERKPVCLKCFRNKWVLTATTRLLQYCYKCL